MVALSAMKIDRSMNASSRNVLKMTVRITRRALANISWSKSCMIADEPPQPNTSPARSAAGQRRGRGSPGKSNGGGAPGGPGGPGGPDPAPSCGRPAAGAELREIEHRGRRLGGAGRHERHEPHPAVAREHARERRPG